jgi:predicted P-loop ATPase
MPNDAGRSPTDWMALLQKRGSLILGNEFNACIALEQAPEFAGTLALNTRTDRVEIRRACPAGKPGSWRDENATAALRWLQGVGIPTTIEVVERSVRLIAFRSPVDPVAEYFNALAWDGEERLETWLITYCRAVDTPVTRIVGRKFLIGLAARGLHPGCRMDNILVLEGRQGLRKSTAAAILGGPWHSQDLPDFASRDAQQIACSHLVIEIADMSAFARAHQAHAKAFITRTHDTYIGKWKKHPITRPRWSTFITTINREDSGYLTDRTGNRRYWPIAVGEIDTEALARDRELLLAEACHYHRQGEKHWIDDEDERQLLEQEQDERLLEESWGKSIVDFAAKQLKGFTILEVATGALAMREGDVTPTVTMRISAVLREMGLRRARSRQPGGRVMVYQPPEKRPAR